MFKGRDDFPEVANESSVNSEIFLIEFRLEDFNSLEDQAKCLCDRFTIRHLRLIDSERAVIVVLLHIYQK